MTDDTQITWQGNNPRMDEMADWVRRLVRALRKAAPGNALAEKALDDLKRRGLLGDVLREEPDPLHVANEQGEEVKDAARYRRFFDAGLPITFMGVEYEDKASLDAAIDADLAQKGKT